jgi:hypothetical protein
MNEGLTLAGAVLHASVACIIAVAVTAGGVQGQVAGDANCNGSVEPSDLTAVIGELFSPTSCAGADANRDSRISAPDVDGVILALPMGVAATPTGTGTVTQATPTPTPSGPQVDGPQVTFFGLVNADGCAACDVPNCLCLGTPTRTPEMDAQGRQVFETMFGNGFLVVVEGRPGRSGLPVGTFVPPPIPNSSFRPDLQVIVDQSLGNGDAAICGDEDDGVPGINPLSFEDRAEITDAMIDLACRFEPLLPATPCTLNRFGGPSLVTPGNPPPGSQQFCLIVSTFVAFPVGTETTAAVRLTDTEGNVGAAREIVVRVREP